MDCPHHEHIAKVIDRLEHHCNGIHVQQHHIEGLRKDVDVVTKSVQDLCETVAEMKQNEAVDRAKRDSNVKLLVALVTAAGVLAQAVITHLLK